MRLIKYYIVLICVFGACKNQVSKNTALSTEKIIPTISVDKNDLELNQLKGKWFYNGKAFYADNKLQGQKLNYSIDGNLISESNYKDGQLDGVQKIWFDNGTLAKKRSLKEGKEEGLQQAWLENGKIYVNYEAKNGRVFGMKRANLCYQLKNEKIVENEEI